MRDDDLLQIRALFDEVFDLSVEDRQRYLALRSVHSPVLCDEVERLFALEKSAVDFLAAPVLDFLPRAENAVAPGSHLGPYRIERELGRGGMGVVYLAVRDDVFRKQVAIKLVWPGLSQMAERFRQERQMLADLEHPHIARLLDGGATAQGWQYLVMEYVEGVSLKEYCTLHNLAVRARLDLFLDICAAVQHAHQRLIIHRDLKPSNILVTAEGQVKLLDFGIAKALDATAYTADLSLPGIHLMTPEYASPEQLAGDTLTTASDIYSLGVVLFELLAGQRPFQFTSRRPYEVASILQQQALPRMSEAFKRRLSDERGTLKIEQPTKNNAAEKQNPNHNSSFVVLPSALRGDLDNIVMRALQPNPQDRYASVAQFSEDIRRHLNGEIVQARQPTLIYRAHRFMRRHTVAFSAGAAALLVLLLWLAFLLRQVQVERAQARAQRRQLYAAEMKQSLEAWKNNDLVQMQKMLERWQPRANDEDLRGFEWRYLQRLLNASTLTISLPDKPKTVAYFAADKAFAVGLEDETVRVFDATTGHERRTYPGRTAGWEGMAMITATQELIRLRDHRTIVAFDLLTGQVKHEYTHPHGRIQWYVYYPGYPPKLPACYEIAEETGALSIVDVATNTEHFRLPGGSKPLSFYDFSQSRNLLISVTGERTVPIDHLTRQTPPRLFTETASISSVEITADGQKLLLQTNDTLHVRDASTGRILSTYPGQVRMISCQILEPRNNAAVALSKSDGTIELCTFPSFHKIRTLTGHTRPVTWMGFTTDNQFLLSTALDRTVRLWDWRTGQEKAVLRGHTGDIASQWFVDGKFVTASQDRTLRIWELSEVTKPSVLHGATDHILTVAFSPDNKHVAAGGKDNNAIIHDSDNGAQQVLRGHQKFVYVVRFSPDGRWLATGSDDGTAKVWDVATGRELYYFSKGPREYWDGVRSLAFLPDGQTLVLGINDGTVIVWDVATNQVKAQFKAHTREILSLSLSPDGKLLASSGWNDGFKIWDTTTWQQKAANTEHQGKVWSAVFSPDGKQLATGSGDQTIKLWDVGTLHLLRTLTGHNDGIFQVAYTPDGKRLASVSDDQTVKLWNPHTGQELLTLREHTNEVWGVAFSPDGKTMLTGSWDKTLRLWRAVTP